MKPDFTEQLFMVYGNLVKQCDRKYSSSFYRKSDTWVVVKELPEEAQYIGNYPVDINPQKLFST